MRKLMCDQNFEGAMKIIELEAWFSFKSIVEVFLGNNEHP